MGFPFGDIIKSILQEAPQVIWNPALGVRFLFFWAMVVFVWSQYRRTAHMQEQLYGQARRDAVALTARAALEGLAVGLAGSFLMIFFGVSFLADGGGLIWVLVTAVALMLVNARFMCFAYAGGLVSLSHLIFGWPQISVPDVMALVAILHLMESLLILLNGSAAATPVYLEQEGRQVGAFYLQRAWPVPVGLLILIVVSPTEAAAGIAMPDWWPLLRTAPEILAHPGAIFLLHALPAALGYGDLAVTCPPKLKTRRTALNLVAYSLVLLALCVGATHLRALVWVTALFAPLGHEVIVRLGNRQEMRGRPYFVPPETGVMVLDVLPGSPAGGHGIGPGWVILEVNGQPVTGRDQLETELQAAGRAGRLDLIVRRPRFDPSDRRAGGGPADRPGRRTDRAGNPRRISMPFSPDAVLGIIPVPEPGDDMGLVMMPASPLLSLLRRIGLGSKGQSGRK